MHSDWKFEAGETTQLLAKNKRRVKHLSICIYCRIGFYRERPCGSNEGGRLGNDTEFSLLTRNNERPTPKQQDSYAQDNRELKYHEICNDLRYSKHYSAKNIRNFQYLINGKWIQGAPGSESRDSSVKRTSIVDPI